MWRVKRKPSTSSGSASNSTSIECLNNSLKISTAAASYVVKRPPLRRPKNKPGKPKDFVFVDLSPVKSEEQEVVPKVSAKSTSNTLPLHQAMPSPTSSVEDSVNSSIFDFTQWDDSFNLTEEGALATATTTTEGEKEVLLGLGIQFAGLEQWTEQQEAAQPMPEALNNSIEQGSNFTDPFNWFGTSSIPEYPTQRSSSMSNTATNQQSPTHKRLMSAVEYSNKRQHFETPKINSTAVFSNSPVRNRVIYHEPHTSILETPKLGLDDFLMLNYQFRSALLEQPSVSQQQQEQQQQPITTYQQEPLVYSPLSEYSEDDSLGKPIGDFDAALMKDLNLTSYIKSEDLELGNFVTF